MSYPTLFIDGTGDITIKRDRIYNNINKLE